MNVYWFDMEATRDWRALLAGYPIKAWNVLDAPTLARGDVLVCHQTYLKDHALDLARRAADRGVAVLAVSGVSLDGAIRGGVYYRAAPVDRPIDRHFNEAFCRFARALEAAGVPDWRLIEPVDAPECLLACYLLVAAGLDPASVIASDGHPLLEAARQEYRLLLRQLAGHVEALPDPDASFDLAALRTIVQTLRSDG